MHIAFGEVLDSNVPITVNIKGLDDNIVVNINGKIMHKKLCKTFVLRSVTYEE